VGFEIGHQSAGVINNVDGDQRIAGGQQGMLVDVSGAREAVHALRVSLDQTPMPPRIRTAASKHMDEVADELAKPAPDKRRVGEAITKLTNLLVKAGALASAGSALMGPLTTLARWVAPFAADALSALG
jgi:hypothetical protein